MNTIPVRIPLALVSTVLIDVVEISGSHFTGLLFTEL